MGKEPYHAILWIGCFCGPVVDTTINFVVNLEGHLAIGCKTETRHTLYLSTVIIYKYS